MYHRLLQRRIQSRQDGVVTSRHLYTPRRSGAFTMKIRRQIFARLSKRMLAMTSMPNITHQEAAKRHGEDIGDTKSAQYVALEILVRIIHSACAIPARCSPGVDRVRTLKVIFGRKSLKACHLVSGASMRKYSRNKEPRAG